MDHRGGGDLFNYCISQFHDGGGYNGVTVLKLYSGNGKSYSLNYEEGMHEGDKSRCIADEGKILVLYDDSFYCRDVLKERIKDIEEVDDQIQQGRVI